MDSLFFYYFLLGSHPQKYQYYLLNIYYFQGQTKKKIKGENDV